MAILSQNRFLTLVIWGILFSAIGCSRETAESKTEPEAEVEAIANGRLQLSSETQKIIGLKTTEVSRRPVTDTISTTGWLMVKPGHEVQVKAAVTGFVLPVGSSEQGELGSLVAERQELGKIHIFLSPQEEAQLVALKEDADILIEQSLASLAIAEERYEKVNSIENVSPSGRELQTLREDIERSKATLAEAREKLPFLPLEPYSRPLRLNDVAITSSLAGRITQVHVLPRQLVVQGDPLWTVSDWSTLWVRVPVFEGDFPKIDPSKPLDLRVPGSTIRFQARATGIPQPTEDGRRTVNQFYELRNTEGQLRPGQPVSVEIPITQSRQQIVIPHSALLWDGMGNSWVYIQESAETFHRQRVQVGVFQKDAVAIERGLDEHQKVVTVGAETLYEEEFKSQSAVEDDD